MDKKRTTGKKRTVDTHHTVGKEGTTSEDTTTRRLSMRLLRLYTMRRRPLRRESVLSSR